MKKKPTVVVCAGGGGVGKTTTSAALALALAWRGSRTLIVTVDPARRLADAMGTKIGTEVSRVELQQNVPGRLYALMPEPRRAVRLLMEHLFVDEPEALARLLRIPAFQLVEDALAGIHELVSVILVARAVEEHSLDHVIVDTAPSRYALDLVSYPGRLASLLEGRAVAWFGGLAQRAVDDPSSGEPASKSGGLIGWGKRRVEAALGSVLGPHVIRDVAGVFAELARVRVRFAELAREAEDLLLGRDTRFVLVAAPTGSAEADLHYLAKKLTKLERHTSACVLNRADVGASPWIDDVRAHDSTTASLRAAVDQLEVERAARTLAGDEMAREIARRLPKVPLVRLPNVAALHPADVVGALATELAPSLEVLCGLFKPRVAHLESDAEDAETPLVPIVPVDEPATG